jgi:acetylxylan esterase
MFSKATALLFIGNALAAPLGPELQRRACPNIHVFGARETTAAAGFGSAGTVVNLILNAHPGATSEAINYPASGGDSYGSSVVAGVQAVTNQVTTFANQCPDTEIVLVGYSQVCIA